MESLEDHYLNIEKQGRSVEIATRVKDYNRNVDIVKLLTPKILESIITNPPDSYDWIILDGKKCLSWRIFDDSSQSRWATQSINLLQDGSLMSTRMVGERWEASGLIVLEHIGDKDEAAQSDYHGGCGYRNGDRNAEKALGSYTLNGLCFAMSKKALEFGIDIQEPGMQKSSAKKRKGLFSFLLK